MGLGWIRGPKEARGSHNGRFGGAFESISSDEPHDGQDNATKRHQIHWTGGINEEERRKQK